MIFVSPENRLSKVDPDLIQAIRRWKCEKKDHKVRVFVHYLEGSEKSVLSFLEKLGCKVVHKYRFKPVVSVEANVSLVPEMASHDAITKISLVGKMRALDENDDCN